MSDPIYIDRPPRIQPALPFEEIEIPAPPDRQAGGLERLAQMALPLLMIVSFVLVSTMGTGRRNPLLVIPMVLAVGASAGISIYTYLREKQRNAAAERDYRERLVEMNREMHAYHDQQRRFYHYNYPDIRTTVRIVENARSEVEKAPRTLRGETRLWERRVTDDDFGAVRLGMGTLPSTVVYELQQSEDKPDDPLVREARKLEKDSLFVTDIPVIISLRQPPAEEKGTEEEKEQEEEEQAKEEESKRTPVTHAVGIAGERASVYEYVRAMLAHFVVFHAPMDARLYILATRRAEWSWADRLPHSLGDDQSQYRCFVEEVEEAKRESGLEEDDEGALAHFLEGVRKALASRKIQLQERDEQHEGAADPTLPFLLVVVDMMDAASDQASPLYDLEADAAMSILVEEGATLGAAVVFLVPERSKVPSGCQSVIEIERTTPATNSRTERIQKLHFRYAEAGVNTFRYIGEADLVASPVEMEALAEQLAQLDVRRGYGASLTNTVPFLELYGYPNLQQMEGDVICRWQNSAQPRFGNWLRCKIGRMSGNKPRTLVFSAKRDGVHGMVAGSTGSGKSELLISLIAGMGVTYDPTVLNFVLVDYKGGGAFAGFETLPHCVDIITNLAADGVTRMFTAINAEMHRRQRLNVETNTKNIVEYRQRGLHLTHAPYPFLFIIIDEFAEMIADRAEFKAQLESITRLGRAQGVSLILAAQRPSGVTDQMRANIKFRVCLRVETPAESREMLRRTDAAFLPGGIPGRGYLQVGNEEIELIQVAYTGDKYVDPTQTPRAPVIWPDRGDVYDVAVDQEPPELYRAIVDMLDRVAREQGIPEQSAPWPDFLPTQLALSELLISADPTTRAVTSDKYLTEADKILLGQEREGDLTLNPFLNKWLTGEHGWIERPDWANYAIRPVVGLIDNPYGAQQLPLTVDLPRGHAVIFGASGWGKTTFLRTLMVSLAAAHSPDHLHMYILDLGGRNLAALGKLPHVGAVITPDEEGYREQVEQLLRELDDLIEKRKTVLSTTGDPDVYKYNANHPESALPAVVVALDNFVEFRETFGSTSDDVESVLDKFTGLARQAKPFGVHFVITASQLNALPNQLYNVFTERLTLKIADTTDYRAIVGASVADVPNIPGRGYVKVGYLPLSFQVAVPLDLRRARPGEPVNENLELERLADAMLAYMAASDHKYLLPVRVGALPKTLLFKQILARKYGLEMDETFLPRLKEISRQKWAESLEADRADWLRVTIGVVSGNRLREMHLEAKDDGVHGMVAGGTGSGKSELLMTLIVGLALHYDPSVLNFVLVDYKGGGAFKPFENLPHCVDTITNLNKAAVRRMFTAITAEMQRRQRLCADTATKDIVEYRAKGYHLTREPFPHLFVIIDEYAEMITDNPEFKDELDSITRVGRSIGVNLLLAAQRPTGVTDQMRANIKFRICLRVEGTDTSRELLRRSDAAFLPSGMPGRGYLQVGNENIELMQVAYTGETYPYAPVPEGGHQPKFYDVIVDLCNELLQDRPRPRTPWPPFLPAAITFADPLVEGYLDSGYRPLVTWGRADGLSLNPFMQGWLDGKGRWQVVDWSRNALRAVAGLLDDPYNARQLPLVVDFTKGHAVVFGASGWGKTTFVRSLITSLAATHSPDDFQAHVLDLGGRNLEMLTALPHVGTVIMPDERGYEERVQQLLRELNDIVDYRKRAFSETGVSTLYEFNSAAGVHGRPAEPAILVAVDNFAEFAETFGGKGDEDAESSLLEAFVLLARQAKAYGIHFLITANRLNVLTNKLYSLFTERLTLRLADSGDYPAIVGSQIGEIEEVPGRGYTRLGRQPLAFQVALLPGAVEDEGQVRSEMSTLRAMGQQMKDFVAASQHRYREPLRIDALPKSSSYRQVLTEILGLAPERPFLEGLSEAMAQQWARNATAENADWLRVTLGIASGNRKRTLALEAKRDGVHGLIAGGTGSGKSEMLMTMIVGLAVNYSPGILNFVLVDYKGGGAFKPFERLPHAVDIVTNLNKAAVDRMFTAINAEIRHRQQLNADTGTKDIIEYRREGLHLTHAPYPHLFVIIDEYAEMIDDNPEYRTELESITRVGRAQGINLVLASQRPKGVSDQMRANIKLRLCLRVEQIDTSRELLRRPDAALLPGGIPGRGYLQVGNENLELIQISYTGESQPDDREPEVMWPDRMGSKARSEATEDVPRLYDAVVSLALEMEGGRMAPKPWPAFLPRQVSLQSPICDAQSNRTFTLTTAVTDWLNGDSANLWQGVDWRNEAMRPVAGLLDDPAEAQQGPLRFDLSHSHLVVLGDSGWGKTTLLRTLIVNLTATHSPNECHVYVLDLGGRNFRSVQDLPHVGTVIYADEQAYEERMQRLLLRLERMADERQHILSNADASSLYEYNQRFPDQALPTVLVVIDNFAELHENYEALVESVVMPLVRRSLSLGITFVVSANAPNNMPGKLYALFGERVTFKQSNPDRYIDIVGRGALEIDDIPGRGYIRVGKRPLLFQAALPLGIFSAEDGRDTRLEADELRLMTAHMQAHLQSDRFEWRSRPDEIRILPEVVPLQEALAQAGAPKPQSIQAVLGQLGNLQPALTDLKRLGPHFMIMGPPLSGKTTVLYDWIISLASRYSPQQVQMVLVDMQRKLMEYGGVHTLDELPHVVATASEIEQVEGLVVNLKAAGELLVAKPGEQEIFVIIDNFDDFSDEIESNRSLPREMANLVRRYGRDGLHFIITCTPEGGISELKKRVQSSNYGLGLQTARAVEALRVMRTPAAVRDKELPAGRGFVVKSGQATLIQVATPYGGAGETTTETSPEDEEAIKAQALDRWVEAIKAQYPKRAAAWVAPSPNKTQASTASSAAGQPGSKRQRMSSLLQRSIEKEKARLDESGQADETVQAAIKQMEVALKANEAGMMRSLREIWSGQKRADGWSEELLNSMSPSYDDESVLLDVEAALEKA